MGLGDFVRGQLIEIIEWTDEGHDTLSYRFPDDDREIKRGAQLVVRESQAAQFVYLGQFGDTYGPGLHRLTTDNIPVLSRLKGWKYGFESPFKADIYFVTTRLVTGNEWGTANPIMLRDPDLGVVRVRAFGRYDFRIADVRRFLREVAGTDSCFTVGEFSSVMRTRIVSAFSDALATANVPITSLASRYTELGEALVPAVNVVLEPTYGIELASFAIENTSVPEEVEQAIDKRAELQVIGNLKDYVRLQIAQSLGAHGGSKPAGTDLAIGLVTAGQVLRDAGILGGGAPSGSALQVMTPAEVAQALRVTEADVIASLESGKLKGTRVGREWRVTGSALAEFLG